MSDPFDENELVREWRFLRGEPDSVAKIVPGKMVQWVERLIACGDAMAAERSALFQDGISAVEDCWRALPWSWSMSPQQYFDAAVTQARQRASNHEQQFVAGGTVEDGSQSVKA